MRKEYDFCHENTPDFPDQRGVQAEPRMRVLESIKNPYLNKARKQVTIRLDEDTIAHFKALAAEKGIPCQSLINLYLRECAESVKKPEMRWV